MLLQTINNMYFICSMILTGHVLWQICSTLRNLGLNVSSGSYCTSEIVGSRVMVTHLLPYILTNPLCGQWNIQCSEPGCWLCFNVGYYSTWLWIRLSILSCGAIPQDLCRTLMVSDQLRLLHGIVATLYRRCCGIIGCNCCCFGTAPNA